MKTQKTLEVHEHWRVSGPSHHLHHSHEGGDAPHQHHQYGPASYTIDKDEWLKATGLRGGGRKSFTAKPTGEQLPIKELEDWQKSFEIIVDEESCRRALAGTEATGAGVGPAARMVLAFKMTPLFPEEGDGDEAMAVSP